MPRPALRINLSGCFSLLTTVYASIDLRERGRGCGVEGKERTRNIHLLFHLGYAVIG